MAFDDRKSLMKEIEALRDGRRLVALCNFDREVRPEVLGGVQTLFGQDLKEPLFRVLKETLEPEQKLDLLLYTRGGDTNAVWPIACLLWEFDVDFEVLVPYRAHSSGTLLILAARRMVMTPIAELSPIDPTTGNLFNPKDDDTKKQLGISVEDLTAYQEFLRRVFGLDNAEAVTDAQYALLQPHLLALTSKVHPLALGNVHRTLMQIKSLAQVLLKKHYGDGHDLEAMSTTLTTSFYSHHHMISRAEAHDIFGDDHVQFAAPELASKMDQLLRRYEDDFALRQPFFINRYMENDAEKEARLIGGCVESRTWGYLHETKARIRQYVAPPQGVQIQVPPGQVPPLIPGLPRRFELDLLSQSWVRNKMPIGVTT